MSMENLWQTCSQNWGGGTHTEDCDDSQSVLNLLEATGHSTGWISVEFIGSDDEYTEYCEGFWQC